MVFNIILVNIILVEFVFQKSYTFYDEKGENMGRFFCRHAVQSDLFQAIASAPGFNVHKSIANLSANIMEETLLNVSFLSFQFIMEDKIVTSIDLADTH